MRRVLVAAIGVHALTGCYSQRTVTDLTPKAEVRIDYDQPRPDLTIVTSKHEEVVVNQVRRLDAVILATNGDSVTVLVLKIEPNHPRAFQGVTTVPGPRDTQQPQRWTRQQFSAGKTAALVLGPPVIVIGLLILLIAAASPGMGGY